MAIPHAQSGQVIDVRPLGSFVDRRADTSRCSSPTTLKSFGWCSWPASRCRRTRWQARSRFSASRDTSTLRRRPQPGARGRPADLSGGDVIHGVVAIEGASVPGDYRPA